MEFKLQDHLNKCRFCFQFIKSSRKVVKISEEIENNFICLVGVELKSSSNFSRVICQFCNQKLSEVCEFKQKLYDNQTELYRYVEEQDDENDWKVGAAGFEPQVFCSFIRPEEVKIKVEAFDVKDLVFETEEKFLPLSETVGLVKPCEVRLTKLSTEDDTQISLSDVKKNLKAVSKFHKKCPYCAKIITSRAMSKHLKVHFNEMKNTPYICDHCDYQNFNRTNLTGHMEVHISRESLTQFKCNTCDRVFYRKGLLQRHERNVHGKSASYPCDCDQVFKSQTALNKHKREAHNLQGFRCTDCGLDFNSRSRLKQHAQKHKTKVFCEVCGELIGPGTSFEMHMKTHEHANRCAVEGCGLDLTSKEELKSHMDSAHGFEELKAPPGHKICPVCAKILTARAMYKHLRVHKNKINKTCYQCDVCGFKTFNKVNLKAHMFKHKTLTSSNGFKCGFCVKTFYEKSKMKAHERNVHSEHKPEFACSDCDLIFDSKGKLKTHFDNVHAEKVCCELCGQLVAPGEALRSHMRKHGPRLKCPFKGCTKDFGDREGLAYHKECEHGPSLNLKCSKCDSLFQNLRKLRKHERRQHEAVEVSCPIPGCRHKTKRRAFMIMHFKNHREIDENYRNQLIIYLKSVKMAS